MTRSDLRTLVLSWLDDIAGDYFTSSQVNVWLNNAQRECSKILMQANEEYFLKIVQTSTVASQADYVLPTDFKKLERLELVLNGTGVNEEVNQLLSITLNQKNDVGLTLGTPVCYHLKKNRLTLLPIPDSIKTLRLYYSTLPIDMSSDSDVPDLPDEYHEYIAVIAALDGFIKDDRAPSSLLEKKSRYEALMKQEAEDRKIDSSRTVVMTEADSSIMF